MDTRQGVFLIGATHVPDMIDPAVLRPGRLEKLIHLGFPSSEERVEILRALTKVCIPLITNSRLLETKKKNN